MLSAISPVERASPVAPELTRRTQFAVSRACLRQGATPRFSSSAKKLRKPLPSACHDEKMVLVCTSQKQRRGCEIGTDPDGAAALHNRRPKNTLVRLGNSIGSLFYLLSVRITLTSETWCPFGSTTIQKRRRQLNQSPLAPLARLRTSHEGYTLVRR